MENDITTEPISHIFGAAAFAGADVPAARAALDSLRERLRVAEAHAETIARAATVLDNLRMVAEEERDAARTELAALKEKHGDLGNG